MGRVTFAIAGFFLAGCASVLGVDFDDLKPIGDAAGAAGGGAVGATGGGAAGGGDIGGGGNGGSGPVGPSLPLVCGEMSGLEANAPWPMAGYCPTRQARAAAASFASPTEVWTATLDDPIYSEPVVAADGTAYVVTFDFTTPAVPGRLHAVRDGVAVWFVEVTSLDPPAIGADGRLVHFDGTSVRWITASGDADGATPVGSGVYGSPVIAAGGRILAPTTQGLVAVAPDGDVEWTAPTPEPLRTPAAVGLDGTAYVGSVTGTLYAIDEEGAIAWSFPTGETAEFAPVVMSSDTILFQTYQRLYAIDAGGREKWSFSTGQFPTVPPLAFGDVVYAVTFGDASEWSLWALNDQGIPDWSVPSLGLVGRPALSQDGLLVSFGAFTPGRPNPRVLARHPADGAEYWSYDAELPTATLFPPCAWGNDGVVYAPMMNRLVALGPP